MATNDRAIPVRTIVRTLRELVLKSDPEFIRESQEAREYEFTTRTFKGRYAQRGPYTED